MSTTDLTSTPNEWGGYDYADRYGRRVRTTIEHGERNIYGFDGQVCTWQVHFSDGTPAAVHAATLAGALDQLKARAA